MLPVYKELINKLEGFIRKYHTNQLLKGLILFISGFAGLFIAFVVFEYFGYFNSVTRAVLFYGFIMFNIFILTFFVLRPIAGILKLGKRITLEQAAELLGKHFKGEIDDKILNTLQLKKHLDNNPGSAELIIAGIEQKSGRLKSLPFTSAVNFKVNLKLLPYAFILIGVLVSGWYFLPYIFKESAGRIIRYEQQYERPAPFSLIIQNSQPLQSARNERYKLIVKAEGNILPANIDINFRNTAQRMTSNDKNTFEYEFRSVNEPVQFFLSAGNYRFGPYLLNVLNNATIKSFTIVADYPSYTGLGSDNFINIGDVEIPEGTLLRWEVFTEDTDTVVFNDGKEISGFESNRKSIYKLQRRVFEDFRYEIIARNNEHNTFDTLSYNVITKPDLYPEISVREYQDSVMQAHLFFEGLIRDDYGFTDLSFYHKIASGSSTEPEFGDFSVTELSFDPNNLNQAFYHHVDLNNTGLQPGESMYYFFRVTDNDQINGPKHTDSRLYVLKIPDYDELIAQTMAAEENVKSGLSRSREEVNSIQDEIDRLRRSMLESENITWEQQESLKQLLEKQQKAQEDYEKLVEFAEEQQIKDQQFRKQDENIIKKQEELQKLFEDVLSDEMKDLYDKIQQELEKLNRESVFEMLDQFQFEMSDLENRLDRALELFKQLQIERMLSESIDALERLQNKQDQLHDDTNEMEMGSSADEQKDLNEEFESISDLIDEMMQKNEELERPNPLDDTSPLQDDIKGFMEQALNQLLENNSGPAQQNQRDASQGMQELGNALQEMQAAMQQQNLAEDIRTIREILDNLVRTSFAQEDLMQEIRNANVRDPRFVDLIQDQRKISTDLKMIQDSLNALARRQIQIESFVTREIAQINLNIDQAIDHLINRRKHSSASRQQFVMTHVNNLALLLNESMQNMQMQMQAEGQGQDSQASPGMSGLPDLRQMQEQMNEMLEQLRQGHQPMQGESGEKGMSMSEQLARMAAEQEAIRNRLNEMAGELRKDGQDTRELEQTMREMERTELDIVTNNISRQTQLRQQRILTRLLEHERAHLEREKEERRVGETAKTYDLSNPEDFFEYNRIKNRGIEMLRSLPPGFKPHYKNLVELYFLNVEQ